MPPKKKQNTSVAKSNIGASSVAASDGKPPPRNVFKGLLAMPVELLRLISTFFGSPVEVPMGHLTNSADPALPWSYYDLPDGLRALSQTCHLLRLTFLPMLWESMDVCVQARTGKPAAFYKHLGDSLQRISAGLSHEPELLTYIRTVNVILTRYSTYEILPVFAGTMTKMPNLHTLQIIHAHTAMTTHLKNGFAGISLPNVQQLILPSWAHEILRCCPEVRHVICTADDGGKLVSAIAKCCKKVEILEGFHFDDEKVRKRIIKATPNLTAVHFNNVTKPDTIKSLAVFKKLNAIRLYNLTSQEALESGAYHTLPEDLQQCINAARVVLSKQPNTKHLSIRHTVEWHHNRYGPNAVVDLRGRTERSAVLEEIDVT